MDSKRSGSQYYRSQQWSGNRNLLATPIAQTLDNTGATAQTVTYNITPWTGTAPGALLCSGHR